MLPGLLGWVALFLALDAAPAAAYAILDDGAGLFTEGWDGAGTNGVTLNYHLGQGTADLSNELDIIEMALWEWASVADITFVKTDTPGLVDSLDFYFTFDPNFSDGVAGGIGRGFGPDDIVPGSRFGYANIAGDVFFDDAELWTGTTSGQGSCSFASCDLYFVALHEIGHSLGLDHPLGDFMNLPAGAVMNPFFNPAGVGFGSFDALQADDVAGLQSLYASGSGAVLVPEPASAALLAFGLVGLAAVARHLRPGGSSPS